MEDTQRAWAEVPAGSGVSGRNTYIAAVPQDILDHPDTDIESLKGYCRERGITFGERPSIAVLRAKLMAANTDLQTVWSLRMTTLAVAAMTERPDGQDHLDQFQAAMYHPASVAPDGPAHVVVAGHAHASGTPRTPRASRPLLSAAMGADDCPPSATQFRRPLAAIVPLLRSSSSSPLPPTSTLACSPGIDGGAVPPTDPEGAAPKESDLLYMRYCAAKRAEDARDVQARQQKEHKELKGMLVSLGQSMANVSSAVQAHVACSTVTAKRHTDGLVSISREQTALRASIENAAGPTLSAARPLKRLKTTEISVARRLDRDAPEPSVYVAAGDSRADSGEPTVRLDMLFSPIMEAELMEARLPSVPLASQLQRIVRLAHVSAGKPGLFGSYVVFGLYESAGVSAAALAGPGALDRNVNKEKQKRMKNIIFNKADTYVRMLFWLRTVLPEVLSEAAEEATFERMEQFTMTPDRCTKLQAALKLEAHKAKYVPEHPILVPAKARMSTLRDLLQTLVVDHDYASNVDEMLKTSPFCERLAEASKRIRPRYDVTPPAPASSGGASPKPAGST